MARESWTDERLDDLNAKVDRGFEQVDEEFKAVRREMKEGFDAMNGRFDAMNDAMNDRFDMLHSRFDSMVRTIFAASVVFCGTTFAALAGILATQL